MVSFTERSPVCGPVLALILMTLLVTIALNQTSAHDLLRNAAAAPFESRFHPIKEAETTEMSTEQSSANETGTVDMRQLAYGAMPEEDI